MNIALSNRTAALASGIALMLGSVPAISYAESTPMIAPPGLSLGATSSGSSSRGASKRSEKASMVLQAKITTVDKLFQNEKNVNFHSVVKASVFAFKPGDEQNKLGYERFWLHDGKAIGMEKKSKLELTPGASVAIHVMQETEVASETKASANVIMRLVLDTLLRRNYVSGVTVPGNVFGAISQELQSRKAHVLPDGQEPPKEAHVIFQLNSDSSNLKQTLYWI